MKSESGSCICEVHDPSGVFPLIAQHIQSLLPLRNLNWKSGDRPLRSIDSLHVDFRDAKDGSSSRPQSSSSTVDGTNTTPGPAVKERRHQIPGLRQTPYLKLVVLRCDDVEIYRESGRKTLKEWLKTHTPPSQKSSSSAQENHDAFEWMIVHVVVPNTIAASQPRYSKSSSKDDDEEPANPKGGGSSRLKIGRKSNTLLEKIKADFNVSSKSAPDRVAQVRLQEDEVPKTMLPARSADLIDHIESPPERNAAWADLITKVRNLILTSFTLRVTQYEDDIRERGSQRNLPGWNFCTFFVLKEGLARGFESVGLLDDALLGYDELSIELDSVIREPGLGTVFLPFTGDVPELLDIVQNQDEARLSQWHWQTQSISATRKSYRELILANQVSIFDFKSYIFARQLEILLRMGFLYLGERTVPDGRGKVRHSGESPDVEDIAVIAEICRRAGLYISEASRLLAQEVIDCGKARKIDIPSNEAHNFASVWSFASSQQIMKSTRSPTLLESLKVAEADFTTHVLSTNSAASRRASFQAASGGPIPDILKKVIDGYDEHTNLVAYDRKPVEPSNELARCRIDMLMLQRQVLESLSSQRGWTMAWPPSDSRPPNPNFEPMSDVNLDDDPRSPDKVEVVKSQKLLLVDQIVSCVPFLFRVTKSQDECREHYQQLTISAIHHAIASDSLRALQKLLADLAVTQFRKDEFGNAARILDLVIKSFANGQWGFVEAQLLAIHGRCLRELNQNLAYVRRLLMLMRYAAAPNRAHSAAQFSLTTSTCPLEVILRLLEISSMTAELARVSALLDTDLEVQAADMFTDIAINPFIEHRDDQDGFSMKLKYRHILDEPIDDLSIKLQLTAVNFFGGYELLVTADNPQFNQGRPSAVVLSSPVTILDEFAVQKLTFTLNKLLFVHTELHRHSGSRMQRSGRPNESLSEDGVQLLSYPRQEAFRIETEYSRNVQIDSTRSLNITCHAGDNTIQKVQLRIKAATGGLRLRTGELREIGSGKRSLSTPKPGIVETTGMQSGSSLSLTIPFDLDSNLSDIIVRVEATYETEQGVFEFISSPLIKIALPLDVSVHDLFKSTALFSRFSMRSADDSPMDLTDIQLDGTDKFEVESPPCAAVPATVYARQPLPVLYKVKPKDGGPRAGGTKEAPLKLKIEYRQFREVVTAILRQNIRQSLMASEISPFANLIEENLVGRINHIMTVEQLTQASMLQEITVPSYEAMDWTALLRLLPSNVATSISTFLQNWHQQSREISLDLDNDNESMSEVLANLTNTLTITVPVPRLQILHTASLVLPRSHFNSLYMTGTLIPATLTVQNTQKWDTPNAITTILKSQNNTTTTTPKLLFSVEIDAPPDQWLIGGMRRFQISPSPEETIKFPVMLMPLKAGRLMLPNVEIRSLGGKDTERLSCAMDYVDSGSRVVVVDGVSGTTVRLREGLGGTEVLVEGIKGVEV